MKYVQKRRKKKILKKHTPHTHTHDFFRNITIKMTEMLSIRSLNRKMKQNGRRRKKTIVRYLYFHHGNVLFTENNICEHQLACVCFAIGQLDSS